MPNYVTYHLHTELSLLDSCTNYKLYVDKAAELGQTAIAFTEHGNIFSWIEKKMYTNSKGLKYIHGVEIYLTETLDEKIRDNYHTILLAKNQEGVKEINLLIDKSTQDDHFYYKPRISFDEFLNISDNVIKISACLASPLKKYNGDRLEELIKHYDYLEVQPHINSAPQKKYNAQLVEWSKKYNKPLIAGTDTHSINEYKAECRTMLQLAKHIVFAEEDSYDLTYKTYDELFEMFYKQNVLTEEQINEALNNTQVMADSIEDFELDTSFKYPKIKNEEETLKARVNEMYQDKVKRGIIKPSPEYKERVQEELRVFKKIDMMGFMVFMSQITCWCWENDIPIGFCRGSVGGSLIAYLLDITDVNPIVWGTVFSRFANEDRKEIGDIDIDLPPTKRQMVYDHIIEEYGLDKTAYVVSFGTISDKGAIDEIARALCEKDEKNKNKYSLANTKHIKELYEENSEKAREDYPELFYYFDGMKGCVVSQGIHPAAIVISPITLPDNYGTFWSKDKKILTIDMEEIHEVSLVKYDLLGLVNVEIIEDCCKLANISYPKAHEVNWNDDKVWEHIADSGVGIFQLESDFATSCMRKMKCHSINDLSMVNGCIRPAGESYRDELLSGKIHKNVSPMIDELFSDTRGYCLFQESSLKFLMEICGLSGSESDSVRRGIGRKKREVVEKALPRIINGYCERSPQPRSVAEQEVKEFLRILEDAAEYQFGFNHTTGYSMIGYYCAWLRYHYPTEFITAFLNNANNEDDIINGTKLAKDLGITISGIKFRFSEGIYTCDSKQKTIYKGLASIKFLNNNIADELNSLKDKQYKNFIDLLIDVNNLNVNSKQLGILIKLNYFEEFGEINTLLKQVDLFNSIYGKKQFKKDNTDLPEYLLSKYSHKETEKMFKDIDSYGLLKDVCENTDYPQTRLIDKIIFENELLGYIQTTLPNMDAKYYFVTDIKTLKGGNKLAHLCQLNSGNITVIKIRKKVFNKNKLEKNDVIKMLEISSENKWSKDKNGDWIRLDQKEDILTKYKICKGE